MTAAEPLNRPGARTGSLTTRRDESKSLRKGLKSRLRNNSHYNFGEDDLKNVTFKLHVSSRREYEKAIPGTTNRNPKSKLFLEHQSCMLSRSSVNVYVSLPESTRYTVIRTLQGREQLDPGRTVQTHDASFVELEKPSHRILLSDFIAA